MQKIDVKIINKSDNPLPSYATEGSSGFDICANEDMFVYSKSVALIHTGLYVQIPKGYEIQIRSRSGLAKKGLFVVNQPGTIDSDYTGEIGILLTYIAEDIYDNYGNIIPFKIKKGDRIAQGVLCPVCQSNFIKVKELDETQRGEGGFGSTGIA